jgi:hypothetical protein
MDLQTVEPDSLTEAPYNPRKGNVEAIKESLRVNGQYRPIVARKESREVLAGNHTLKAVKELGWEGVDVVFVDVDDNTAKKILVADNRTADLAVNDDEMLSALLQDLGDLEGTAYNEDDLAEIRRVTGELADDAMAALDAALGDEPPVDGPPAERPQFNFVVTFSVSVEQRTAIMAALRHLIDESDPEDDDAPKNSNEALAYLCETYNDEHGVEVKMPELKE